LNDTETSTQSVDQLWGLEPQSSVYFYGAPGALFTGSETQQKQENVKKSYLSVVGEASNINIPDDLKSNEKKQPCKFFHLGNCKFGRTCRYSHDVESEVEYQFKSSSVVESINTECGICLGKPEDGVYGVLNNCDCTFCLQCVREWRKEGTSVTHSAKRVR
jgi:hypothetical protein